MTPVILNLIILCAHGREVSLHIPMPSWAACVEAAHTSSLEDNQTLVSFGCFAPGMMWLGPSIGRAGA